MRPRIPEKPHRATPDFGLTQVNIVLLLVLFFLVTGTIVESDEQAVELPETLDLPLDRLPRPLLLIHPGGDWALDGAVVAPEALPEALAAQVPDTGPDAPVHLLLPRDASATLVLAAMAALAPSGREVRLVTVGLPGAAP